MNILGKWPTSAIFMRVFLSFLIIVAGINVFALMIFSWSRNTIEEEAYEAHTSRLEYLIESYQNKMLNIVTIQLELINDKTLNKIVSEHSYLPNYEFYTLLSQLIDRIMIVKGSDDFIDNVVIYFPMFDRIVSTNDSINQFDEQRYKELVNEHYNNTYSNFYNGDKIYSRVVYPNYNQDKKDEVQYIIDVEISPKKVLKYFKQFYNEDEAYVGIYDYESGLWIKNDSSVLKESVLKETVDSNFKVDDYRIRIDNDEYIKIARKDENTGIGVLGLLPVDYVWTQPIQLNKYIMIFVLVVFLVIIAYSYYTYRIVHSPIHRLVKAFRHLQDGNMDVRISSHSADEFGYLYERFNNMVFRLNHLIKEVYQKELYLKDAHIKQLQSQINPHFLYNSFFILKRMILDEDLERGSQLCDYIGNYYKYITRNAKEEIELEKEIEHTKSYINIQKFRFENQIEVSFRDPPKEILSLQVPKMILQPIVENAFKYVMMNSLKKGRIDIKYIIENEKFMIVVSDNGSNLTKEKLAKLRDKLRSNDNSDEITGMINVHRRLRLKYGDEYGIKLDKSKMGGLEVKLIIRCKEN